MEKDEIGVEEQHNWLVNSLEISGWGIKVVRFSIIGDENNENDKIWQINSQIPKGQVINGQGLQWLVEADMMAIT